MNKETKDFKERLIELVTDDKMTLAEYSDNELIEELKHRGVKIEAHLEPLDKCKWAMGLKQITIGSVVFDLQA